MTMPKAGKLKMIGRPRQMGRVMPGLGRAQDTGIQRGKIHVFGGGVRHRAAGLQSGPKIHPQPGRPMIMQQGLKISRPGNATATLPTAYSKIRSQPMIHATNSPSVA